MLFPIVSIVLMIIVFGTGAYLLAEWLVVEFYGPFTSQGEDVAGDPLAHSYHRREQQDGDL
ncbi:hypothetical protein [Altererythrobacter sp. TH136]|uniref:hypothetical protein n=1 Tax=Altererythrobacter sp. TH136 TaxID=2067415 RepID=UPI0011649CA0|nr:hypothetical protein [Altererythrobacter sp. TH136]QDM39949.1 hypothetical protein C0V74_01955 [Altererythrobacter sp. TH136]